MKGASATVAIVALATLTHAAEVGSAEPGAGNTADQLTFSLTRAELGQNPAGDLQLRLPILAVPGRNGLDFPIILTYQSSPRSGQPASWVGLGFNLQVGNVTRTLRYRADEQRPDMFGPAPKFVLDNDPSAGEGTGELRAPSGDAWDTYTLTIPGTTEQLEWAPPYPDVYVPYPLRWRPWWIPYNFGPNASDDADPQMRLLSEFRELIGRSAPRDCPAASSAGRS